ncbi:MAG: hypothetical protein K1X94_15680 [Sandaracinaceae bacterium]|nr:hypothetical protein [Sandaracinaceae bacterium]
MTTPRFVVRETVSRETARAETEPAETAPAEIVLRVEVPTDLVFFEGHFEGNPMLPGVAQVLALVDGEARRSFPALEGLGARRMSRLKFQATIRPGDALELGLALESAQPRESEPRESQPHEPQVRFRIDRVTQHGLERASSGVLAYSSR